MTVAQILLFLPLTLSTLSTPAFLLLSLTLALHAMIHGTMVFFWGSPALSVLQVGIHPVALLVCFNVFASSVNPWILAATRWWGNILTFSGPFFIILEGLSSLIVAQKLGREGKKLIETEDSEVYQFSLLVGSAMAYVTSAWWIVVVSTILSPVFATSFSKAVKAYPTTASSPLSSTLLGVALTALVFLTLIGFVLRRTNIMESSALALFIAYNVWLCGLDQNLATFLDSASS